jgi:ATP-binding cassette subfamily B protein
VSKSNADLRRAFGHFRRHLWRLVPVVVLSLGATVLSLAQPFLSKVLVDRALIGRDMRVLTWTVAGFVGMTLLSLILNVVSGLRYTRVSADILFDMRLEVFKHLQQLPPRYFASTPLGQIASRLNSDIAEIQRVVAEVALSWIGQVVYLIGSVVMLLLLDPQLFLVGLIALPPALWALVRYRGRLEGAVTEVRDKSAGVGSYLIEALQGMRTLVAHNAQERSETEFRDKNRGFVESLMAMRRLTYLSGGLPGVLLAVGSAAVFLYGGWRVIQGEISMGTLVAFAAYQVRLLAPVQGLMGLYTSVASARVSLRRVHEILDTPIEVTDTAMARPMATPTGRVDLSDVSYRFDRGIVLDQVTLTVHAGECVAIVGTSGVGKSTMADLLTRATDPQQGSVCLDGLDLREWPIADVRRWIHTVDTDPFVFHASLEDNLRIASPAATADALWQALALAGLAEGVRRSPQGLATMLGERGRAMSSGERQRLALARAVLADPRVVVLDEATSSLDPATEALVLGAMRPWLRERTTIMVTHRPSVMAFADRVITIREGRVATADETQLTPSA